MNKGRHSRIMYRRNLNLKNINVFSLYHSNTEGEPGCPAENSN